MKPVVLSHQALLEFRAAIDWYAQKGSASIAADLIEEIQSARKHIQQFPNMYPEYETGTRRCALRNFPYSLIYREKAEIIEKISKTHRSVIITQNGEAKAVLTDIETYSKMQNTMAMLKLVALAREDVIAGRITEHSEAKKKFS